MAKIVRRVTGAICIITALLLTQIPAGLSQAATVAKEDFIMDNETLVKYTGTATTVSVSDDVKVIGEEAFANNQYLGVINLGKNLKEIEHGAFANCKYINTVNIPNTVKEVGAAAFSGCTGLVHVSIGDSVESLGDGAFAGCKKLGGISLSRNNNNFIFEAGVLYDNKKEHIYSYLSANPYNIYYMPESVNNISPYSFWGNENLEEVYLSGSLEEVPAYAFSNCKNLKVVQIPSSADSIDAKAFENCISLTDIVIPASVKYIDPSAFDGCYNLNIIADEGTAGYEFFKKFDKTDIANTENQDTKSVIRNAQNVEKSVTNDSTSVNSNIFENTSNGMIDASKDPSNVEWMPSVNPLNTQEDGSIFGKTIVVGGSALLFVDRDMTVNQITNEDIVQNIEEYNENTNVIYDSGKGGYLPKYTYINNNIATQAFYASNNEQDFVISPGTKKIGKFSFARSTVESLVIPEGVEEIGYGAFYHCDNLTDLSIPSSVKKIEGYALDNTPYKAKHMSDTTGNAFWIEGDGILLGYSGNDSEVVIPDSVKTISAGCFEGNKSISYVSIPDSVTIIDSDAFRDCSNLKKVEGAQNVSSIGDRAFMGCPVSGFIVRNNVESIGLRAFDFSSTDLSDSEKVIVFEGEDLPIVSCDETSKRLSNYSYRQDSLYNVLFVVIDDEISEFENTVLDNDTLGFSGIIVNIDSSSANAVIKKNYIYSQEVFDIIPEIIKVGEEEYQLSNKNEIALASNPYSNYSNKKDISVESDLLGVTAEFSEDENVSKLIVNQSIDAGYALNKAYSELFGKDIDNLIGYDIKLVDSKGVVNIEKLGKTSLYVTIPVKSSKEKYHVISLDDDGQLEEIPMFYDDSNNTVVFETNHLSYYGLYSIGSDNVVLNMNNGKIVKNYRLDDSPETGDNSLAIYYVYSILLTVIGLFLILYKKKNY